MGQNRHQWLESVDPLCYSRWSVKRVQESVQRKDKEWMVSEYSTHFPEDAQKVSIDQTGPEED